MNFVSSSSLTENLRRSIVYVLLGAAFLIPLEPLYGVVTIWLAFGLTLLRLCLLRTWDLKQSPAQWAVLGFTSWSLLSIINSQVLAFSIYNWGYDVASYVGFYYLLISYVQEKKEREWLLKATLGSALVVCLYGFYQYSHMSNIEAMDWVDPSKFPLLRRRMFSTLFNPNLLGEYLLMLLGVVGPLALRTREKKKALAYWGLGIVFFLCLLLTYSRGIWVSFAAMVLFWGLTIERRLLFTFLLVPIILFFYHGEIATRLWSLFNTQDTSVALRYALWDSTSYMIKDFPLLGIGWGSFWQVYPQYNYFIQEPDVIIFHAHNLYLHLAAEIGAVGLLFFLAILLIHGRKVWVDSEENHLPQRYILPAILVGVLISGLFDHNLYSFQVSVVFWQMLALGVLYAKKS